MVLKKFYNVNVCKLNLLYNGNYNIINQKMKNYFDKKFNIIYNTKHQKETKKMGKVEE